MTSRNAGGSKRLVEFKDIGAADEGSSGADDHHRLNGGTCLGSMRR